MTHRDAPPLSGSGIDRDARTRMSDDTLNAAWQEPQTRLLRLRGPQVLVLAGPGDHVSLALHPVVGDRPSTSLFLGRWEGRAVFAEVVDEPTESTESTGSTGSTGRVDPPGTEWRHPFDFSSNLDRTERELMTTALALSNWHASHPFSARDGQQTEPALGGWARHDAHGGEHFPRTDPAVIVLVEHEDRLLLGSNVLWESGRFSLLAGFVEAGESAEQAVVREVGEEAGILVDDVRYVASQPWPFPRSLMLGFRAKLAPGVHPDDIAPEPEEISELRWFTRAELRSPVPGLLLPGTLSIARWLIDGWVAEGSNPDGAPEDVGAGS
ncbi:NAD(+) diphosphatase [Leucobacter sp. W1153]|uniref:NAD(+) diphosphatase n=1 Tax=Leucobacter sp. W1153 TaxID=3439064 RepID=UPI003F36D6AC